VGVAFGYQFPDRGPLKSSQFSGGQRTVERVLVDLGFMVEGPSACARLSVRPCHSV